MTTNKSSVAYIFPGQGSQKVGMGKNLSDAYPIAKDIYQLADEILGYSISEISWEDPQEQLNDTYYTQPALFIHSIASLRVLEQIQPELQPEFVAGHSLGQLSAITATGAISFVDGLKLVQHRGELMRKAGEDSPGGMSAILGLSIQEVESICEIITSEGDYIQVANDNCPGQVVVSGSSNGVDKIIERATEKGARRVLRLPVSIAAHSDLMKEAQKEFSNTLNSMDISEPRYPIIGNVTARPLSTPEEIRNELTNQLTNRVRWTESVTYLLSQGVDAFYEIGTGKVLCGLLKRISREVNSFQIGNPEDFEKIQ